MLLPIVSWGPSYANIIAFEFPAINVLSYAEPRTGYMSSRSGGSSQDEDGMLIGFNYFLEVELQFIDNSFWDGSTGVKQWLSDAAVGVPFLWQPTSGATVYTAYLEDPLIPTPTWEPNKTRHIKIKIRNAGNTAFAEY